VCCRAKVWGTELPLILAGGFDAEKAKKAVSESYTAENIIIAFGRLFIRYALGTTPARPRQWLTTC